MRCGEPGLLLASGGEVEYAREFAGSSGLLVSSVLVRVRTRARGEMIDVVVEDDDGVARWVSVEFEVLMMLYAEAFDEPDDDDDDDDDAGAPHTAYKPGSDSLRTGRSCTSLEVTW